MIAITGVTGLTGRFLVPCFRELGYRGQFRCLVRPTSDIEGLRSGSDIEFVVGDCRDESALAKLLDQADALVHVAGIQIAENVIAACRRMGVGRVVFVNTTGMFSKYRQCAVEYRRIEERIMRSGLDYTIIRPTMIYGNTRDHNIHKLVRIVNRLPVVPVIGSGQALLQPIYAQDLAAVIAKATLEPRAIGRAYNAAGKEPLKDIDLLKCIAPSLEKRRLFIRVPYTIALLAGYIAEMAGSTLVNVERVRRMCEDRVFDYSLASEDLGFAPRSFEDGIKFEIAAMRECGLI
ncbi:MAG: NAD-dependent epimerase/dehydratase family protein [Bacillota bacterium]